MLDSVWSLVALWLHLKCLIGDFPGHPVVKTPWFPWRNIGVTLVGAVRSTCQETQPECYHHDGIFTMALNADARRQNRHQLMLLLPPEEQEHPGLLCTFVTDDWTLGGSQPSFVPSYLAAFFYPVVLDLEPTSESPTVPATFFFLTE